jgi:hypothetical protein
MMPLSAIATELSAAIVADPSWAVVRQLEARAPTKVLQPRAQD